ncbi:N-myristoyl transferase [Acephala macrosclerotiorum]|nr:N-myristoyl transferase [Acephala macrosclerotiorum]
MASYKFWKTQPVPMFDDLFKSDEGPIEVIDHDQVPALPDRLINGCEWATVDLENNDESNELYDLLANHYVEDDESMFRFKYSPSFLKWALKPPGWRKPWHVGVRVSLTRELVAFIGGIPAEIRVRKQTLKVAEINFLCIHRTLRSRRLAPVLIKEITRRCYLDGFYQAVYTAGNVLPKPVSTCQYYHRELNWLKLHDIGFTTNVGRERVATLIQEYSLPSETATPNLRPMKVTDVDLVHDLLGQYLNHFDLTMVFTREEVEHWLIPKEGPGVEQVVWTYVVEEPETHNITDFFSFYLIDSSILQNPKHDNIRAAYLHYYASRCALNEKEQGLRERLLMLMNDALILAKMADFDVFNAVTVLDNPLFLERLKFGIGDSFLHYYLFNYRTAPIAGGIKESGSINEQRRGGVGIVAL